MIKIAVDGFDWDIGNKQKCRKHGLTIGEIEKFFKSNLQLVVGSSAHFNEDRYIAVGRSFKGRPMFVAFTYRMKLTKLLIRPISARYMHAKEAKKYEKALAEIEK